MDAVGHDGLGELSRLTELTSDCIVGCYTDGTIFQVNSRLLALVGETREHVLGRDVKDMLFSTAFERAEHHRLPFTLDGSECSLMLKLPDGSFIPVLARASRIKTPRAFGRHLLGRDARQGRVLVAFRNLEERYAYDRQMRRVLSELQAVNRRLSGTLSVIMSTIGAENLPSLLDTVLNNLVDALEADGATIYFVEGGGFRLRGVAQALHHDYVPEFIPFGAGVPTYATRKGASCRLSVIRSGEGGRDSGSFYDLDARRRLSLRSQYMPPFKTLIAVPVFFGSQPLGVIELGWKRPTASRAYDVSVIEVVCDYLSIELMSLAASMRSQRTAELGRSLNRMRDVIYNAAGDSSLLWGEAISEVRRILSCRVYPVVVNPSTSALEVDFEEGGCVVLPGSVDELFFSTTAPAARMGWEARDGFAQAPGMLGAEDAELEHIRLTRIERTSRMGAWLNVQGLPDQGVFFEVRNPEGSDGSVGADADETEGRATSGAAPSMLLLLREDSQEPIDDIEFDYLVRLAHEFEMRRNAATQVKEERRIAQTLQAGMRSSLGRVPGIIADARYSSATRQALVGGDFYTLIQLPNDRAVMILGDVSGKGVEAASMSALVKTALTAYAWENMSPQHMVRSLNAMLMSFSRVETFATMFVASLDLKHGRASYCSAGHPPTMLVRRSGLLPEDGTAAPDVSGHGVVEVELLSVQSGVVGAFEDMAYRSGMFTFSRGDVLFMYTDGAIEARSSEGEFFGEQRLRSLLLQHAGGGARGLSQRVLDELDAFTASALEDDIALVALEFEEPIAATVD